MYKNLQFKIGKYVKFGNARIDMYARSIYFQYLKRWLYQMRKTCEK